MRPMQFPRRFPWLIALVLLPFSGVLFLPLGLWYWLAYPPVQHYYLGAYFESAFAGDHSDLGGPACSGCTRPRRGKNADLRV